MARKASRIPAISSLEATYEAAAHRARRRLASKFPLETVALESPDFPGRPLDSLGGSGARRKKRRTANHVIEPTIEALRSRWREVWRIDISSQVQSSTLSDSEQSSTSSVRSLMVAIPPRFPDELPAIYLSHDEFALAFPIPHLDWNRHLCTFDSNEVVPVADHPAEVVFTVVERAIWLLMQGLSGANHDDFVDEFSAYWAQESTGKVVSLVEVGDKPKEIWSFSLGKHPLWEASHILADNRDEANRFLRAIIGAKHEELQQGRRSLYLPLPHFGIPPFPTTNAEIWQRLGEISPHDQSRLLRFLVKAPRPCAVLFSVPSGQGRTLGLWWHPKWDVGKQKVGGRSGRNHATSVPGFRPNVLSVAQELKRVAAQEAIERASVERLDTARLQSRTIGQAPDNQTYKINVVGCGSLGSHLTAGLAALGEVGDISLVDPQTLQVENVPRHLCPLTLVGQFKAKAVASEIAKRSPLIRLHPNPRNILDVLREEPDALQSADFSLIALGNFAAERRLNRLAFHNPELFSPLCFVWVEPMALGGHALWLPRREKGTPQPCFECAFDENLLMPQRILKNPMAFSRREAGCQTTFVPYGGLNLTIFLASLTRFLLQCLQSPPTEPVRWSWAGDLDSAQTQGLELLNPSELAPFSCTVQPLTSSLCCPLCGTEK